MFVFGQYSRVIPFLGMMIQRGYWLDADAPSAASFILDVLYTLEATNRRNCFLKRSLLGHQSISLWRECCVIFPILNQHGQMPVKFDCRVIAMAYRNHRVWLVNHWRGDLEQSWFSCSKRERGIRPEQLHWSIAEYVASGVSQGCFVGRATLRPFRKEIEVALLEEMFGLGLLSKRGKRIPENIYSMAVSTVMRTTITQCRMTFRRCFLFRPVA